MAEHGAKEVITSKGMLMCRHRLSPWFVYSVCGQQGCKHKPYILFMNHELSTSSLPIPLHFDTSFIIAY